jgi:hypothetical protein
VLDFVRVLHPPVAICEEYEHFQYLRKSRLSECHLTHVRMSFLDSYLCIFHVCCRGSCKESKECGSGICTFMRCRCHAGFVGPNCLVSGVSRALRDRCGVKAGQGRAGQGKAE